MQLVFPKVGGITRKIIILKICKKTSKKKGKLEKKV